MNTYDQTARGARIADPTPRAKVTALRVLRARLTGDHQTLRSELESLDVEQATEAIVAAADYSGLWLQDWPELWTPDGDDQAAALRLLDAAIDEQEDQMADEPGVTEISKLVEQQDRIKRLEAALRTVKALCKSSPVKMHPGAPVVELPINEVLHVIDEVMV